jgi:hypothetical protein
METETIQKNGASPKSLMSRGNCMMIVSAFLLFLSSCVSTTYLSNGYGTRYETSVNSFGNYNMVGKTFYIESGDNNISSTDVEFREYADYVAISLELQGAIETSDKKNADMCILVNYGITDESYTESVPMPVWGRTGISSINTISQTNASAYGSAYGSATLIGNSVYGSAYGSVSGNSATNTNTQVNYNYGITGFHNVDRKVTVFRRVMNIYTYDNQQTANPRMIWKTNLLSDGYSNDLRKIIPYMAYTAWGKMGKSSDGWKDWLTFDNDYYYQCWKNGSLLSQNVIGFPKIKTTNVPDYITIALVEKKQDETIVVIRKTGCINWYNIASTIYIEYAGRKYNVKYADYYKLGTKIVKECGTRYIRLHFPAIPKNATSINISEGDNVKKGFRWEGVAIR